MRTLIFLTLGFTLFRFELSLAQPEPITIEFIEAEPVWEHLMWDTTFFTIGNNPGLNKYTTVQPRNVYRFGDDLFLTSFCQNYNAEIYGYVFEKINIKTGEIKWQSYNTYYNNGLQDFYKNLYMRPDGNLEMIGIKRHGPYLDSIPLFWNVGGGKSNFIRKIFDYNNGNLLQSVIGQDSIGNIVPQYLNFYPIKFDNTYLAIKLIGEVDNGIITYNYKFYEINNSQSLVDTLPIASILYETNDTVGNFSYGQPQFTEKINDSTLIGLVFQDKVHPDKTKAQLIWMDISDLENIKVIKRENIEDYIPGRQTSFLYFSFKVINDLIYITQPYRDSLLKDYTSYLTCFDREGNLLHFIPKSIVEGNNYQSISLVYASDDHDYFAGFPSKTGRKGFDILKFDHKSSSFNYVSSLTSAHLDENFALQMEVSNLYDDGLFVIGAYTKKEGPALNTAVKYYCFRGDDLGMVLNTSTKMVNEKNEITIYPNPTNGLINFDFDQVISGKIVICDITGKELKTYKINGLNSFEINLDGYPYNIYYACIINENTGLKQTKKIVYLCPMY
jgi:hypothetical protein